jgi:hypothetical protein
MGLANDLERLIARMPGLTEAQLAKMIYGKDGYQQKVNSACRQLVHAGRVERRGKGYALDPFTYHRLQQQDN